MGCPTVKIVSKDPENQGPYIIINESDFDAETMALYDENASVDTGKK